MLEPRCRVSQGFLRAFFTVLAIVCCANLVLVWSGSGLLPAANRPAGIVHVVMFEFKSDAAPEQVDAACARMLSLKDQCLHPTTNKPYVKSAIGGIDNSPEGLQNSITHAFIVEFENKEDRKYYLENDPAHLGFVESIGGIVAKAQVVDFVPGVF